MSGRVYPDLPGALRVLASCQMHPFTAEDYARWAGYMGGSGEAMAGTIGRFLVVLEGTRLVLVSNDDAEDGLGHLYRLAADESPEAED